MPRNFSEWLTLLCTLMMLIFIGCIVSLAFVTNPKTLETVTITLASSGIITIGLLFLIKIIDEYRKNLKEENEIQ